MQQADTLDLSATLITVLYTVLNANEWFPSPAGNPGMSLILYELFLHGQEYFCLKDFFPDQERKILRNPEFPEVFLARKIIISDILGFSAADGDPH